MWSKPCLLTIVFRQNWIVETEITAVKGATILFEQRLVRETVVLSKATVKIACVDLGKMKPVAIPEELKAAFLK